MRKISNIGLWIFFTLTALANTDSSISEVISQGNSAENSNNSE